MSTTSPARSSLFGITQMNQLGVTPPSNSLRCRGTTAQSSRSSRLDLIHLRNTGLLLGSFFVVILMNLKARAEESVFDYRLSVDTILATEMQDPVQNSIFNPGNQNFKISRDTGFIDLRPNFKFLVLEKNEIVLRPRLHAFGRQQPELEPPQTTPNSGLDFYLNEGYVAVNPAAWLRLSGGRENFQWGPAESLSPSNFFVESLLVNIEPFFEIRGIYLARANVSLGTNWSWISLAELNPVDDNHYTVDRPVEKSEHRVGTKLEYSWDNSAKILGLVVGGRNQESFHPAFGGYGSYTMNDAVQIYADGIWQELPGILYPTSSTELGSSVAKNYTVFAVAGGRYTFSDGTEFRLEYIENEAGYTKNEQENLKTGLSALATRYDFSQAAQSSPIALPGQHYLYAGVRVSSQSVLWDAFRQPMVALHALISLTDSSSFTFTSLEAGLSDNATAYIFGGVIAGTTDSELRRSSNYVAGLAYRFSY